MPKTDSAPTKRSLQALIFQEHFQITYRVVLLTLIPLTVFGGAGYFADKYFKTNPTGLIIGVVLAFLISQYAVYMTFTSMTRQNNDK